MSLLTQTLDKAMQDRCPDLYQQMKESRQLQPFLREKEAEISGQIAAAAGAANAKASTQGLDWLETVQAIKNADQSAREVAIAQAVESLPDETSSPSRAETTDSLTLN